MNPIHQCFQKISPVTHFCTEIKGYNSDNNRWILSIIELDLYFMIIYLCMKYESNTPMYSKDIARNHFSYVRDRTYGMYVCTYLRTRVMLYAPPPTIINGGGIKKLGHRNLIKSSSCPNVILVPIGFQLAH